MFGAAEKSSSEKWSLLLVSVPGSPSLWATANGFHQKVLHFCPLHCSSVARLYKGVSRRWRGMFASGRLCLCAYWDCRHSLNTSPKNQLSFTDISNLERCFLLSLYPIFCMTLDVCLLCACSVLCQCPSVSLLYPGAVCRYVCDNLHSPFSLCCCPGLFSPDDPATGFTCLFQKAEIWVLKAGRGVSHGCRPSPGVAL